MIHPLAAPGQPPTRQQMQSAVEAKLHEIETTVTDLLQEVGNVDPFVAETLRGEASRLSGIAFTLTKLLCYDDVERAHQIVIGDPDNLGEALGLTA